MEFFPRSPPLHIHTTFTVSFTYNLRSLSIIVIVAIFLPGKNEAGDVTLPEITKLSVPSTKSSSTILMANVWIVPLLAPARKISLVLDSQKSSVSAQRRKRVILVGA